MKKLANRIEALKETKRQLAHASARIDEFINVIPESELRHNEDVVNTIKRIVSHRDELAALLRDWRRLGTDRWHQGTLNEATDEALAKLP